MSGGVLRVWRTSGRKGGDQSSREPEYRELCDEAVAVRALQWAQGFGSVSLKTANVTRKALATLASQPVQACP